MDSDMGLRITKKIDGTALLEKCHRDPKRRRGKSESFFLKRVKK